MKPGQIIYIPAPGILDFSASIRLTCRRPTGNNTGVVKLKKWGQGAQGDKNARWRRGPCPWMHMLHNAWVARGGGKKAMQEATKIS